MTTAEQLQAISEQLATMASTDSEAIQNIDEQLAEFEQLKEDVHEAMNANYQLFPNKIKQVSLEQMYADIVAASVQEHVADENAVDLTGITAFGIQCLMSHGEEIMHSSGTRMFHSNGADENGEPVYTELNDGVNFISSANEGENEIVNLFFFPMISTGGMVIPELPLNTVEVYFWYTLDNTVTFTNINDVLKNVTRVSTNFFSLTANSNVTNSYFNVSTAKIINFLPDVNGGLGFLGDGLAGTSSGNVIESDCTKIYGSAEGYTGGFGPPISDKIVCLPKLKTINSEMRGLFWGIPKEYMIEKIESFGDGTAPWKSHFHNWGSAQIVIPSSVKNVGKYLIGAHDGGKNNYVRMNCKNANPITDINWITEAPTQVFSLCPDWGASIYLVKACSTTNGWNEQGWRDFFTGQTGGVDNLRDFSGTGEEKTITMPNAMFTNPNLADAIAVAEAKGWTIIGG